MKRIYFHFFGRVQGVGFRYTMYMLADKYKCSGFVRNLDDGSVEAQLQGRQEDIEKIIFELTENQRYINISKYFQKPIDLIAEEKDFRVTY